MNTNIDSQVQNEIQNTIQTYVNGYLQADGKLLGQAFHSETRLHAVSEQGALERTEMADWLANLESRKARGDIRQGEFSVLMLDVTGPSAVAKVLLKVSKLSFTDYLSLLRVEGAWKITGKIYTVN